MLGFAWHKSGTSHSFGPPGRFWLWIDGVGGYLVCLSARVTLGQATAENAVDVPLLADVGRTHATLTRDTEGYILAALRPARVNGRPVDQALLRSGDRVTLGKSCQFQFLEPAPVSASAAIELTSSHRLPLAVNAVLLMADTLLLGPGTQVHVRMPDVKQPVVIFRTRYGLGVRCAGGLSVDGKQSGDRSELGIASKVVGSDFSFALEPIGAPPA